MCIPRVAKGLPLPEVQIMLEKIVRKIVLRTRPAGVNIVELNVARVNAAGELMCEKYQGIQ